MSDIVSTILLDIADRLTTALEPLQFSDPVSHVYNPLTYARAVYAQYAERYGQTPKEVVFFGMNPGPWGMSQTGIPFGEVGLIRSWLQLDAPIETPTVQHPKRPILGWDCHRTEVSGQRLWGWAKQTFDTPEAFFSRFFVACYCPLAFLEESGRNRTPDKLKPSEREALFPPCDRALREVVEHLQPKFVIGIGNFAHQRAQLALGDLPVTLAKAPHPSPASPQSNQGWGTLIEQTLAPLGIDLPLQCG